MHWLETKIRHLHEILERQAEYQKMTEANIAGAEAAHKMAREDFREAVSELVESIASREGVAASFACHEGLLVESAGASANFEALAAVGQSMLRSGIASLDTLGFCDLTQMVLIGQEMKLALFSMGQIGLGIAAGRDINLSGILK